jgi:NADPH:quinone reductase-like Zn-dependent oxidoreductase
VVTAPAGSSHAEAATLPTNGLTMQQALDAVSLERMGTGRQSPVPPERWAA